MSAVLLTPPYLQFFDDDGNPLAGGKIYTYAAGTDTPKATYTTQAANVEQPNPVVLDDAGRPLLGNGSIWITGAYKIIVKDSLGDTIETVDNITSFSTLAAAGSPFFQSFSGDGSTTAFTLSTDEGTDSKGLMVFVSSGIVSCVTNGTFATDTGWTKGAGWTIAAGVATATGAISTAISQTSPVTLVQGQAYSITYTITVSAGTLAPSLGGQAGTARSAAGTYMEVIVAGATQTTAFTGAGFTGTLDNVTINIAAPAGFEILNPNAYTIAATALTFAVAPATGTNNIFVFAPSSLLGAASSAAAQAIAAAAAALTSQTAAATSATAAATSATAAASSATSASSSATTATTQASNASTSATNAASSATSASSSATSAATSATNAASTFTATSVSSNSIGTGAKTFTTQASKNFVATIPIIAVDSSNAANYIQGTVTSYSGTTLVINGLYTGGSGTITSWNISVSGVKGADGSGTVTTSGSPASGNLTKFTSATAISNTDLTGDVTTSGTAATTVAKIQTTTVSGTTGSGNVVFNTSPTLVTPVLGVAAATSIALGGGTALANYLEGTFTPTLKGASVAGTPTYVSQLGTYVRFGKVVFITIYLEISNLGSASGQLIIGGLPIAANSSASSQSLGPVYYQSAAAATYNIIPIMGVSETNAYLFKTASGSCASFTNTDATATLQLRLNGCYLL